MLTKAQVEQKLNQVITAAYTEKRPALESSLFIPAGAQVAQGVNSVSYTEYTEIGMAKMVGDYSKDFPPVTLLSKERYMPVATFGDSYSFSFVDLLNAQQMNMPLETAKASTARYAIEQALDRYALIGNKDTGVTGFFNNENVPVAVVSTDLATATADEVAEVFQSLLDNVDTATKGTEKPNAVVLPAKLYAKLNTRRIADNLDTRMLQYLKDVFPQITSWDRSSTLDEFGEDKKLRIVLYTKDASAVSRRMALNFTQLAAQWSGAASTVNCLARSVGTIFHRPLSAIYGDVTV